MIHKQAMTLMAFTAALALKLIGCAETMAAEERARREFQKDMEKQAAATVRITRNESAVRGCQSLGIVSDDWKDLQKKAARMGGNTAFIMMQSPDTRMGILSPVIVQVVTAEVYRCPR